VASIIVYSGGLTRAVLVSQNDELYVSLGFCSAKAKSTSITLVSSIEGEGQIFTLKAKCVPDKNLYKKTENQQFFTLTFHFT
jgi:hypothetical protein